MRNSGITAVVEGIGDHGCEYMTGGKVAILGKTGRNFGAGMSGGVAYVYNPDGTFEKNCNQELVLLSQLSELKDMNELHGMLENHYRYTESQVAKRMLDHWETEYKRFVKVIPKDYKLVMDILEQEQKKGVPRETAVLHAFEEAMRRKSAK